ncbi:ABC-three component system protein [Rothia sp. ZJ1223]|uniref:ABC-three component system protein n=1 Tax=Rothia sp. ZJ1223 TaxID=2811098 RepID=UPI001956238B|nr:ABC-three component system protein [Rothia sp. ZJ1223]MBM7051023.1 hypothetical protein [Rothia sp. ZJ1223]
MKFFELAQCLEPAVPGGLARAPYLRELISMFTTVTEADWATRRDPSSLPSDSTLESMYSRDAAFPKKLAMAMCAKFDAETLIRAMDDLDLAVQELIATNIEAYGEHIDLEDFPYEVTELLVRILHDKAGLQDKIAQLVRQARITSMRVRYEKLLLARSRGCTNCQAPQSVKSHGFSRDSYDIVFLDDTDEVGPDDFAVLCKGCAEKYDLAHTSADITQLRKRNASLLAAESVDAGLAPLGLETKITALLRVINQLPLDEIVPDPGYKVLPLQEKLDDASLIRSCRDSMALYEKYVRKEAQTLDSSGALDFELMRHQIVSAWFTMRNSGMSQYQIAQRLSQWIDERTNIGPYACQVLVAFMIQICDLFAPKKVLSA